MKTNALRIALIAAVALVAAAPAALAADWWYTVYKGDKHVGYCHAVESTSNLGGAVVKRLTFVTEAEKDKGGRYTYKETADRYHDSAGALVL